MKGNFDKCYCLGYVWLWIIFWNFYRFVWNELFLNIIVVKVCFYFIVKLEEYIFNCIKYNEKCLFWNYIYKLRVFMWKWYVDFNV